MLKDKFVTEGQAQGKVKEIYEDLKKRRGKVPKLYMALAKDPECLEAFYNRRNMMARPGKIDLCTKEIVAFAVSVLNNCHL